MPSTTFNPNTLPSLSGKVFIVTGGNAGIGYSTVAGLAHRGAKVYMGARSEDKAIEAIDSIKKQIQTGDIKFLKLDLSSFSSVVQAAETFLSQETSLHGLINNAGIMAVPFAMTGDGFESQFQTNYLSHWLLTNKLLPILQETATKCQPGSVRIVNVTSDGHERYAPKQGIDFENVNLENNSSFLRYGQSKLANVLHVKQLHAKYGPDGSESKNGVIWTAAVHPGHIRTNLGRQATGAAPAVVLRAIGFILDCAGVMDDQDKGAVSSLYAIASSEFTEPGAYIVPYAKIGSPSPLAKDARLVEKLWNWTYTEFARRGLI